MVVEKRIIVALDGFDSTDSILKFVGKLHPSNCRLKVGLESFVLLGPSIVQTLSYLGFEVFLDLKFKDIPNTVAGAIKRVCDLGVWMTNLHIDGGVAMMEAAINEAAKHSNPPLLIGVSVLTSMSIADLAMLNVNVHYVHTQVAGLIDLADTTGLDGVVCAAPDLEAARTLGLLFVTPGIRLPGGDMNDQVRIATPEFAIESGADFLVVGRPITGAADPALALDDFNQRVAATLALAGV